MYYGVRISVAELQFCSDFLLQITRSYSYTTAYMHKGAEMTNH